MLQKNYNKGIALTKLKVTDISQQTLANIINSLNVDWTSYTISTYPDSTQVIEFQMPDDTLLMSPTVPAIGDSVKYHTKTSTVFILRADTVNISFFMKTVEDATAPGYQSVVNYLHYQQIPTGFTGNVMYFTLNRDYLNGWHWQNGSLAATFTIGGIVAPAGNNIHHVQPDVAAEPCTATTLTVYSYQYGPNGEVLNTLVLFSYTTVSCPDNGAGTPGTPSPTGSNGTGGGASGAPSVPAQVPCNPSSVPVTKSSFKKGRIVDEVQPGTGTGSGGGSGTTSDCVTTTVTPVADPCAQAAALTKAATAALATQNSNILAQTNASGNTIEYGANQNLTSLTSNTYVNTPITPGTTKSWTPTFTWSPPVGNIGGYTIGYTHAHTFPSGPSGADVNAIVVPTISIAALKNNPADLAFFEANAYVNTETNEGSYMLTINNWATVSSILLNSYNTPAEITAFNANYAKQANIYYNSGDNNLTATPGDEDAYALMSLFNGAINMFSAPYGSTTFTPITFTTDPDGTLTITKINCPQ